MKKTVYLIIIIILSVFIVILAGKAITNLSDNNVNTVSENAQENSSDSVFPEGLVTEETVTMSNEMIEEGLRAMGVLITEEYYFTQVEQYNASKKIAWVFKAESEFTYSYDGVVSAGIDFEQIDVNVDNDNMKITVSIPEAEIQSVSIDYDSFKIYSEEQSIWNKLSIADYNTSLTDFEKTAKEKALNMGLIDKANNSAGVVISNFVNSLVDTQEYTVDYVQK